MLKNDFLVPPLGHPPISEPLFITSVGILHRRGGPPCPKLDLDFQADEATHTPWGCGEVTHTWGFLGRGGRMASRSESGPREQGKGTFWTFIVIGATGEGSWGEHLCMLLVTHGLNFPPAPGKGAPGLSYRLPICETEGKGGRGAWGLDRYQQWNITEEIRVLVIDPNSVPISANGSSILSAEQRKTFESSFLSPIPHKQPISKFWCF